MNSTRKTRHWALACLSVIASAAVGPAALGQQLISCNAQPGALGEIHPTQGWTSVMGPLLARPDDLAYDAASKSLYGVSSPTGIVFRITDRAFGVTTAVAVLPYPNSHAMTFDSERRLLFGADLDRDVLWTLDPQTLEIKEVGPLPGDVEGLAFDPTTNTLFGIADATDQIVTINRDTAAATPLPFAIPARDWRAIAMFPAGRSLYFASTEADKVYRLDLGFGAPTVFEMPLKLAMRIDGLVNVPFNRCMANCNNDNRLNIRDFVCYQNAFALGNFWLADLNLSGGLDIQDFTTFQEFFAIGCLTPGW